MCYVVDSLYENGYGSLGVMVTNSWLCRACHEFKPSGAVDLLCRELLHVKSTEAQSPSVGVVWKLGEEGARATVLSLTLDHGSE
ncbi:hypothetical protein TNCV_4262541 [Trichonephila clavipes]|nr:hypothetical protein TNCV_4262541 [Trichonephila clavipes]